MPETQLQKIQATLKSNDFKNRIAEILDKKAPQFVASALSLVSNDKNLSSITDTATLYTALLTAATLDLPINQNLGFAYIIGYNGKAQFQMGYKGFIQLAMRSGQFKTISVSEIYEGQINSSNPLTGFEFDFEKEVDKKKKKIVGYAAYFSLTNGFEKTLYMTKDELTKHGVKFSQTFKKGYGLWKDNFDAMAKKTVIKLLLSKYGPLSTQMQQSITHDQAVIREDEKLQYIDAEEVSEEEKRLEKVIEGIKTRSGLEKIQEDVMNTKNERLIEKYSKKLLSFGE